MIAKDKVETELNRLNANLKKLVKDKEYQFEMYCYAKNSWTIHFRKLNH